jgi:arginyl-tRNA synthetase|tara:strand:- start:83 stop:1840 length:1758 start_codon:yes stop_codon:yes gene_type:complete
MNVFNNFSGFVNNELAALKVEGLLPKGLDTSNVSVDPPRDATHGDITCNAAMVLAKPAGIKPRELAELLAERLRTYSDVEDIEIAGPGFLNLRLTVQFWHNHLRSVISAGDSYGNSRIGNGALVNVEYISANPTGPLHVGHARGAVFGDVLAALLEKSGYLVTREYYINDAGAQVDELARSLYWRYCELLGKVVGEMPNGLYPGDYLISVAERLIERDGSCWDDLPENEWLAVFREYAVDSMMENIRDDLSNMGINQSTFISERSLVDSGMVQRVVDILEDKNLIYIGILKPPKGMKTADWEERPQTLFKSSQYGDDVDRPLKKSDGTWTYFASDLAYHLDKNKRGFTNLINIWGADHGGYIKRVSAGIEALTDGEVNLDIKLCQLVRLLEDGEVSKMSKRSGNFVMLRELINSVGKDVVRFIMLTRKNDAQLDFDLIKVLEQSRDNPVFYVQYAHARSYSVVRMAKEVFPNIDFTLEYLKLIDLDFLKNNDEIALIKLIASWPRIIESAADSHEPHRLAFYLCELAAAFHSLWSKAKGDASLRFVVDDDLGVTQARIALVLGVRTVIASGLDVMGITPLEELRA